MEYILEDVLAWLARFTKTWCYYHHPIDLPPGWFVDYGLPGWDFSLTIYIKHWDFMIGLLWLQASWLCSIVWRWSWCFSCIMLAPVVKSNPHLNPTVLWLILKLLLISQKILITQDIYKNTTPTTLPRLHQSQQRPIRIFHNRTTKEDCVGFLHSPSFV